MFPAPISALPSGAGHDDRGAPTLIFCSRGLILPDEIHRYIWTRRHEGRFGRNIFDGSMGKSEQL